MLAVSKSMKGSDMTDVIQNYQPTVQRAELVAALRARDGNKCRYPGCIEELDFNVTSGRLEVTIDHWIPQWYGKDNGWTRDEIWDLSNLRLMHKKCNAKKGDLIPFVLCPSCGYSTASGTKICPADGCETSLPQGDGILPPRPASKFRYRRDKRADRLDGPCDVCDNGHALEIDEICAQCGMDAQRFPRWAKMKYKECDHELFWCIWCSIGDIPRPSSIGIAMRQADSTELGEL